MKLHLMQHGQCLSEEIDPEQPLSSQGRDQIAHSALAVRALGLGAERILASPKLRSRQTAQAVAEAVGLSERDLIVTEHVKAMADPRRTVDFIASLGVKSVFIAGHQPHLGRLASHLLISAEEVRLNIQNGGLVSLETETLPTHTARLLWCLTPLHMQALAGSRGTPLRS